MYMHSNATKQNDASFYYDFNAFNYHKSGVPLCISMSIKCNI